MFWKSMRYVSGIAERAPRRHFSLVNVAGIISNYENHVSFVVLLNSSKQVHLPVPLREAYFGTSHSCLEQAVTRTFKECHSYGNSNQTMEC